VRAAHAGEVHLDPAVARRLTASLRRGGAMSPRDLLTRREIEILSLVARGQSNKEIASWLVISERTARTHVSNILGKLGLSSRTQAALWAVREGLVPEA
jgi:DNA-binding NarL/FixJ family response regulator